MYKCPKCGSTDLRVEASAICVLTQYEGGAEVDIPLHGVDLEWDNDSIMLCADDDCQHIGKAFEFEVCDEDQD